MKLDDILPILVLLIYVALVFAKHRKIKADAQKKAVPKGEPTAESQKTAPQKAVDSPDRPAPKPVDSPRLAPKPVDSFGHPAPRLFPLIGERLRRFFVDMEQQFRAELEKARTQGLEPESPEYQLFDYQGEPIEPESGEPSQEPESEPIPVLHPVAHVAPEKPHRVRQRSGCFRDHSRSRQRIRNAIVWSEILEPPLALRRGKRPWEP